MRIQLLIHLLFSRRDDNLKRIVYKLVPGLFKSNYRNRTFTINTCETLLVVFLKYRLMHHGKNRGSSRYKLQKQYIRIINTDKYFRNSTRSVSQVFTVCCILTKPNYNIVRFVIIPYHLNTSIIYSFIYATV